MHTENFNSNTKSGTLGGTIIALLFQVSWSGILNTMIVAAVGAATSFLVSMGLNYLSRKGKKGDG